MQKEINLEIMKTIQKEKDKSSVDILFALEALFQLGVTLALSIDHQKDLF